MVGVLCIGVLEVDCVGVVDVLVLGVVFVVEVVEGVELVVECVVRRVVRLVLWCVRMVIEVEVGLLVLVGVGVVEVLCSVRMGVGVGGAGNRGGSVVSGGRNTSVADGGADGERPRWRACCRFPDGIFGELREDLSYRLPFTLDISGFFS